MKKIVRLTENDLIRLVKKVMNEQLMNYAQPKSTNIPNTQTSWQSDRKGVNLYSDINNTKLYKSYPQIISIGKDNLSNINVSLLDGNRKVDSYIFNCDIQALSFGGNMNYLYYNKTLIDDLDKKYCTTSSGGTKVPNVGRYSNVDSNKPMNIA